MYKQFVFLRIAKVRVHCDSARKFKVIKIYLIAEFVFVIPSRPEVAVPCLHDPAVDEKGGVKERNLETALLRTHKCLIDEILIVTPPRTFMRACAFCKKLSKAVGSIKKHSGGLRFPARPNKATVGLQREENRNLNSAT